MSRDELIALLKSSNRIYIYSLKEAILIANVVSAARNGDTAGLKQALAALDKKGVDLPPADP